MDKYSELKTWIVFQKFLVLITLILLMSCSGEIEISKSSIKCSFPVKQGFKIYEIDSIDLSQDRPKNYQKIWLYSCLGNWGKKNRKNLDEPIRLPEKYPKVIYFNKKNELYYWSKIDKVNLRGPQTNTLPLKFKNEQWYMLDFSLCPRCGEDKIFFLFENSGTTKMKRVKYHLWN